MKTLLEWLEENRSTLKDGVYEVTGLGNICCNDRLVNDDGCILTTDKYEVRNGVITRVPQPLLNLEQWLMYNNIRNGIFETDSKGLIYVNGFPEDSETYVQPTTDKYEVVNGVVARMSQPLPSLYTWLVSNDTGDGIFETDRSNLVLSNGSVYKPETYVQPTTDKYKVLKRVVRKLDEHEQSSDPVNSPSHYASGDIECIDAIKASMTREAFLGYLKGNIQKYMWRYEKKVNPLEDIKKARWYMNKLVDELDK